MSDQTSEQRIAALEQKVKELSVALVRYAIRSDGHLVGCSYDYHGQDEESDFCDCEHKYVKSLLK